MTFKRPGMVTRECTGPLVTLLDRCGDLFRSWDLSAVPAMAFDEKRQPSQNLCPQPLGGEIAREPHRLSTKIKDFTHAVEKSVLPPKPFAKWLHLLFRQRQMPS